MRHIRFHNVRHTAATNRYELSGDFYATAKILGHSLKGTGKQLGLIGNVDIVTARYIDVRSDRVKVVLDSNHNALFPNLLEKVQNEKNF